MWNLLLNEDETAIADSVRKYLAGEQPLERLRPKAPRVDSTTARKGMAELGWFGVGLPESAGGAGLRLVEEMLIQREFGRFLVTPSALAVVLAGHVAAEAGDAALAQAFTSGNASAALVILPEGRGPGDNTPAYAFDRTEGDFLLAWTEAGMGLFEADAIRDLQADSCLDDSVTMHRGILALGSPRHWVTSQRAPLVQRAQVLLAAALVGLAEHACELTVEYAKVREQFGKPIGSFQAVKHRCADMGVRARLAWYQTSLAALKLQAGTEDSPLQVASASLIAAQAAHENARAGIQLHGGIGFQAECDVHWFMKRAHLYDQLGGGMQALSKRIATGPAPSW